MITYKATIDSFEQLEDMCWSGALTILKQVKEKGRQLELMCYLEMLSYDQEWESDTAINDFIWFDLENCDGWTDLFD